MTADPRQRRARQWACEHFSCPYNSIPEIDSSAVRHVHARQAMSHSLTPAIPRSAQRLLTSVKSIDLSNNLIAHVENLQSCWKLEWLNLAFNRVSDISNINQMVGNLKALYLRNNNIANIEGLEKLYSLEILDLANNKVTAFSEVELLSKLPLLSTLWLMGNPVAQLDNYRNTTLRIFAKQPRDVRRPSSSSSPVLQPARLARLTMLGPC